MKTSTAKLIIFGMPPLLLWQGVFAVLESCRASRRRIEDAKIPITVSLFPDQPCERSSHGASAVQSRFYI
jgi:hypothetical protein